ncbi:MAG: alanine racemase [Candidatus Kerfeldbacteria bacterium]|nr:alanine racemase [Candidatus Kerfeldbacteria bacterium]
MAFVDRTWIELSTTALYHNLYQVRQAIGPEVGIAAVLKANAYGHGWRQLWPLLASQRLRAIAVAHGHEALALRQDGYRGPLIVLTHWLPNQLGRLVSHQVELVVWDFESWKHVQYMARRLRRPVQLHLKLDTGTSRIGFVERDLPSLRRFLSTHPSSVTIRGIFSHLANAEEWSTQRTNGQIKYFTTLTSKLRITADEYHLACTAAALRYPASRLSFIRLGIGLYGHWPSTAIERWARGRPIRLQPVLSWYSRLSQVKRVPRGAAVGYGSTVQVRRPTVLGLIPVGYSDGYDRRASNRWWVIVNNRRAPVIGRVSMNLLTVDLTDVPGPVAGQRLTLVGTGVSPEAFSRAVGTIHYEVLSRLHPDIPRYPV